MSKCIYIYIYIYTVYIYIYISGGPLSALTCCVNARLLSAIKKISPLIYSQTHLLFPKCITNCLRKLFYYDN